MTDPNDFTPGTASACGFDVKVGPIRGLNEHTRPQGWGFAKVATEPYQAVVVPDAITVVTATNTQLLRAGYRMRRVATAAGNAHRIAYAWNVLARLEAMPELCPDVRAVLDQAREDIYGRTTR